MTQSVYSAHERTSSAGSSKVSSILRGISGPSREVRARYNIIISKSIDTTVGSDIGYINYLRDVIVSDLINEPISLLIYLEGSANVTINLLTGFLQVIMNLERIGERPGMRIFKFNITVDVSNYKIRSHSPDGDEWTNDYSHIDYYTRRFDGRINSINMIYGDAPGGKHSRSGSRDGDFDSIQSQRAMSEIIERRKYMTMMRAYMLRIKKTT